MAGSTRSKAQSLRTQTLPAPTSTSVGATPSPIVRTTSRDLGSIRKRVLSSRLPTQTEPSPTAGPVGLPPTGISPTIVSVPGSMTATESPTSSTGAGEPPDESRAAAHQRAAAITRTSAMASARAQRVGNRRCCRTVSIDSSARARGASGPGASSDESWRRIAPSSSCRRGPGSIPSSSLNVRRARRYVSSASAWRPLR